MAIGLLLLAATATTVAAAVLRPQHVRDGTASLEYCLALHRPQETVTAIRGAVAGRPVDEMSDLAGLQARSSLFFSSEAAAGAPPALEADAHRVIRAFRSAISRGSVAPLDDPGVETAVRRLNARGDAVCDGAGG